jgi:hypothetical protein
MQGPEGAAARVAEWLNGRIPARLRIIEEALELEALSLADPAQVIAHERGPIGIEDWPSVFVLPTRTVRMSLVDVEEGGAETYSVTYAMQLLAWVRADDYEATNALRLRYALAIREALLERKTLTLPTGIVLGNPESDLAVDPNSITENYSPLMTDEAKRTIAAVDTSVNIIVREELGAPPALGEVDELDITEQLIPHPSLA